jgi:hypothetical protein
MLSCHNAARLNDLHMFGILENAHAGTMSSNHVDFIAYLLNTYVCVGHG